jgi:hypothetical protein
MMATIVEQITEIAYTLPAKEQGLALALIKCLVSTPEAAAKRQSARLTAHMSTFTIRFVHKFVYKKLRKVPKNRENLRKDMESTFAINAIIPGFTAIYQK